MWYNEPQYLADIEEHLGVTIQQVRFHPTSVADPGCLSGSGPATQRVKSMLMNPKKICSDATFKT